MSLPSIHEMFPDHVMRRDIRRPVSYTRVHYYPGQAEEDDGEMDDYDDGKPLAGDGSLGVNSLDALGRKHVCPTCCKRFNRPSSLRIHLNTHTGATRKSFKCPWPNCGREFNVNSNMRRHYRNHMSPARIQVLSTHAHGTPPPAAYQFQTDPNGLGMSSVVHGRLQHLPDLRHNMHGLPPVHGPPDIPVSAPEGQNSVNHGSSMPPPSGEMYHANRDSYQTGPDHSKELKRKKYGPPEDPMYSHHKLPSLSRSHSERPHHSASYSSPPEQQRRYLPEPSRSSLRPKYNPSRPYLESLKDPRVSTTLRPAFK